MEQAQAQPVKVRRENPPTARELQILNLVSLGRSNAEAGQDLHLVEDTIKSHMRHLMRKLGVNKQAHAVRVAFELGYLPLRDDATTAPVSRPRGRPGSCGPCRVAPPPVVPDLCEGHRRELMARLWQTLRPVERRGS